MSEPMRKHPIKSRAGKRILYIVDNETVYAIPKNVAEKYMVDTKSATSRLDNVSAGEVFADLNRQSSKAATLLRGLRSRENLSQVAFAKRIKVSQTNLSKMENGSRPIGKTIAKRIADAFDVNYRYFIV